MKRLQQRLTIFQKMEIVEYAKETRKNFEEGLKQLKRRGRKNKQKQKQTQWIKGLNLQRSCSLKFGEKLKGIKVCQLLKQAEEQKWHLLTEHQQRSQYQLSDSLKLALGLQGTVKGWKALPPDVLAEKVKVDKDLPRWTVPGQVLEERVVWNICKYLLVEFPTRSR